MQQVVVIGMADGRCGGAVRAFVTARTEGLVRPVPHESVVVEKMPTDASRRILERKLRTRDVPAVSGV